jgi:predicted ATPase
MEPALDPRIERIEISGYRPFEGFAADPGQLTVIVGANGSGKSRMFEAMRILAKAGACSVAAETDFRRWARGRDTIELAITIPCTPATRLRYAVEIEDLVGVPRFAREHLAERCVTGAERSELDPGHATASLRVSASQLRSFVASWGFYTGFEVGPHATMRQPACLDGSPVLAADGSNLTAVLSSLVLEHPEAREELEMHLGAMIPGFESLGVRSCGAEGLAIGTWRERGVEEELTLADLSEGALRVLCWLTLAFSPNLPPVVFIDEPEVGLHPSALSMLAGALEVASARSQILIVTHSPYFLSQFELDEVAVMRKEDGRSTFVRPATSDALRHEVEERGGEALARLFVSEELEVLP